VDDYQVQIRKEPAVTVTNEM